MLTPTHTTSKSGTMTKSSTLGGLLRHHKMHIHDINLQHVVSSIHVKTVSLLQKQLGPSHIANLFNLCTSVAILTDSQITSRKRSLQALPKLLPPDSLSPSTGLS
ncbi:hypothetical protein M758_6G005700 [Ceratodon purpureus]|nr:hypothetical protein M758_6G005700 [Ceratodon purpureus]